MSLCRHLERMPYSFKNLGTLLGALSHSLSFGPFPTVLHKFILSILGMRVDILEEGDLKVLRYQAISVEPTKTRSLKVFTSVTQL